MQLIAYAPSAWLCISTSRFPITDLDHTPNAESLLLRHLELDEGAALLYQNLVLGSESDRQRVSVYLEGHPLALRIFAASIPKTMRVTPFRHLLDVFGSEPQSNPFLEKLIRLLDFYSANLDSLQRSSLQALSLFRSPVPQSTLAIIVSDLFSKEGVSVTVNAIGLFTELGRLVVTGLVIRDRRAISTFTRVTQSCATTSVAIC